jgi:3'-phosphoadenosine 5'-phosphosulfate sulfotransferase (PAPS reductase)/FAD synthetase
MLRPDTQARERRANDALANHEEGIRLAAASLVASHNHVALSYSGGAESGLLLHLLLDVRQWLTVLWVNPGALPHEAEHVRRQTADWPRFVEIPSDRKAAWRKHGLPTWLLPIERAAVLAGDGARPEKPPTTLLCRCLTARRLPRI